MKLKKIFKPTKIKILIFSLIAVIHAILILSIVMNDGLKYYRDYNILLLGRAFNFPIELLSISSFFTIPLYFIWWYLIASIVEYSFFKNKLYLYFLIIIFIFVGIYVYSDPCVYYPTYGDLYGKNSCYNGFAKIRNDAKFCNEIENPLYKYPTKDDCYIELFDYVKDESICKDIESPYKEICLANIADPETCQNINDTDKRDLCWFIVSPKNMIYCNYIDSSRTRNICIIGQLNSNVSISVCDSIQDDDIYTKKGCIAFLTNSTK